MDIQVYEYMFNGLKDFLSKNAKKYQTLKLVHYPSSKPEYPYIVFEEIRNTQGKISFGDIPDVISNLGYIVRIYTKTIGNKNKMAIARELSTIVDDYCCNIGLRRVSFNPDPLVADGDLYGLVMMYNANLYNNKQIIIL